MDAAPTACESCGRPTTGARACRTHPGARLLDLRVPEDAAWAASMRGLIRQRRTRALVLGGAVGLTVLLGLVLMAGVGETRAVAAYKRDSSVEVVIVLGALVAAVSVVAGRIGRDALRAVSGRPPPPAPPAAGPGPRGLG